MASHPAALGLIIGIPNNISPECSKDLLRALHYIDLASGKLVLLNRNQNLCPKNYLDIQRCIFRLLKDLPVFVRLG